MGLFDCNRAVVRADLVSRRDTMNYKLTRCNSFDR